MKQTKECLNCEDGQMIHDTRNIIYDYKGGHISIQDISGWFCNQCGEVEFDKGEGNRYAKEINKYE